MSSPTPPPSWFPSQTGPIEGRERETDVENVPKEECIPVWVESTLLGPFSLIPGQEKSPFFCVVSNSGENKGLTH